MEIESHSSKETHPSWRSSITLVQCDSCGSQFRADSRVDYEWVRAGETIGYEDTRGDEPADYCPTCFWDMVIRERLYWHQGRDEEVAELVRRILSDGEETVMYEDEHDGWVLIEIDNDDA